LATTADDWTYIKTLTAITADGNIPIDLIAQTIGNLDVNVAAAETINADIVAQTVGNLDVNLKANAIGNIPMNINEQGVGDILINLNTQSVDRVTIRDHDGGIESTALASTTCNHGVETDLHSWSGKGSLKYLTARVSACTDSHFLMPRIYIDGTRLRPDFTWFEMNNWGYNTNTRPCMLTKYTVDGECMSIHYFEKGLIFDTSIAFKAWNSSADQNIGIVIEWFYQKIV